MGFPLRGTYMPVTPISPETPRVKVLFTVAKKRFKRANRRNLLKRRMRESWRPIKGELYTKLEEMNLHIELSINYITNDELDFTTISKGMEKLLGKVIKGLQSNKAV